MNLAALFSGGKDSTYSIYLAKKQGHHVKCLVTVIPFSEESMFYHFPNIGLTSLQAKALNIPQITVRDFSNKEHSEENMLEKGLEKAKSKFNIDGVIHGGIMSEFQKNLFLKVCSKLNLKLISPIWKQNQKEYMNNLLDSNFRFIISSVTASGLDDSWLGKEITKNELSILENLANKHGFNLNFEGGEAETFVLDCPIFISPIKIKKSNTNWDGYRGRFEILEANLDNYAR